VRLGLKIRHRSATYSIGTDQPSPGSASTFDSCHTTTPTCEPPRRRSHPWAGVASSAGWAKAYFTNRLQGTPRGQFPPPSLPVVGLTHREEYSKGVAEDQSRVLALDEQAEVPAGHNKPVLMTEDFSPIEPEVSELKFYAKESGQAVLDNNPRSQRGGVRGLGR